MSSAYLLVGVVNVAAISGGVYLALNDHPWMALLCFCCCMSIKDASA